MTTSEPLLKPATYDVLQRVPCEWMSLQDVKEGIAAARNEQASGVTRRLSYLAQVKLIETRSAVAGKEVRRSGGVKRS